jgi:gliding motility-associated-like protein
VKNGVGCTAKDSLTIKMICDEARVAVPNAFTPNGDGHNDEFIIKGISVVKHLLIFNRWGQKVFERSNFIAADRSACWNGTLKGYPASEGTYVYFIEMECPGGGVFTRKGSFVLVR